MERLRLKISTFPEQYLLLSVILVVILGVKGCDTKMQQAAKPTPEICSRYKDVDKKNWCLGRCDEVKRDDYKQLCTLAIDKRTELGLAK